MAVGPFVARAQMKREDAAILDLVGFQDVRAQGIIRVVADQAGVAIYHHQPDILGPADQQVQVTAVPAHGGRTA